MLNCAMNERSVSLPTKLQRRTGRASPPNQWVAVRQNESPATFRTWPRTCGLVCLPLQRYVAEVDPRQRSCARPVGQVRAVNSLPVGMRRNREGQFIAEAEMTAPANAVWSCICDASEPRARDIPSLASRSDPAASESRGPMRAGLA